MSARDRWSAEHALRASEHADLSRADPRTVSANGGRPPRLAEDSGSGLQEADDL